MTSISDKDIVEDIVAGNGKSKEGGDTIEYIIEYHNIFDRSPTWKLCRHGAWGIHTAIPNVGEKVNKDGKTTF